MKKQGVGHFNEEAMAKKRAVKAAEEEEQKAAADTMSVGCRCKVQVQGQPTKLGTVMYVGECGRGGAASSSPRHWFETATFSIFFFFCTGKLLLLSKSTTL